MKNAAHSPNMPDFPPKTGMSYTMLDRSVKWVETLSENIYSNMQGIIHSVQEKKNRNANLMSQDFFHFSSFIHNGDNLNM